MNHFFKAIAIVMTLLTSTCDASILTISTKLVKSAIVDPLTKLSSTNSKLVRLSRLQKIRRVYKHVPMNPDHVLIVVDLCYQYGVDPDLVLALIEVESHYKQYAKNKTSSARGYSQMISSTARSLSKKLGYKSYVHHVHAYDPNINLHLMVYYVSYLLNTSNSLQSALVKYRGCNDQPYIRKVLSVRSSIKHNKAK